ncbi:hypothetical protein VV869_11880 [Photobacterium sp. MCCC 1A19761]|uniref:hypothetical protein n=1 Tax=Photobacterium sp. MCCC 1A19761 TaxID=3115000 RepID=UPI00307F6164
MQLVFHLNNTWRDVDVALQAKKLGIALEQLSKSAMRELGYNGFVLGFCGYSEDEMGDALNTLLSELVRGQSGVHRLDAGREGN